MKKVKEIKEKLVNRANLFYDGKICIQFPAT